MDNYYIGFLLIIAPIVAIAVGAFRQCGIYIGKLNEVRNQAITYCEMQWGLIATLYIEEVLAKINSSSSFTDEEKRALTYAVNQNLAVNAANGNFERMIGGGFASFRVKTIYGKIVQIRSISFSYPSEGVDRIIELLKTSNVFTEDELSGAKEKLRGLASYVPNWY